MPDEIDRAQEREQEMREDAIAEQVRRAHRRFLTPAGACHYCGEPVRGASLFCDTECGWAWEEEQAARKRNGES